MPRRLAELAASLVAALVSLPAAAFDIAAPPPGGSQRSTVIQHLGLVTVSVDYSSPRVTSPAGENRRGRIWGQLVPYGLHALDFNDCTQCPWRAGANENTVFATSHDIKVQGKPLPAGSYGLFMIAGKESFTVIFSSRSTAWGAYWYDPKEDVLRVETTPEPCEFHEALTYDFDTRFLDRAVLALKWDELRVPIEITVDGPLGLYATTIRDQLKGGAGFQWQNLQQAAQFCLDNRYKGPECLDWAERAVRAPYIGQENLTTLTSLGLLQLENGKPEAGATLARAAGMATTPVDAFRVGRPLVARKMFAEALRIFAAADARWPGAWPLDVGFLRAYAGLGDKAKALEAGKRALAKAPDDSARQFIDRLVKKVEAGEPLE
ncbi:MAG: DUF2911 domain-containing protein [Acidobacteriota bacterium]